MRKVLRALIGDRIRNNPAHIPHEKIRSKDLLDIGPGRHLREEFVTVDYNWRGGLDVCWDITEGLPLDNACVSGVFTEHCIEHVPLASGDLVIREIFRVLKPGGRVRIVVPDAELYLRRYVAVLDDPQHAEPIPYADRDDFHGIYQPIMSVNRIMHEHGHQFLYDLPMLSALLQRHGFVDIERCDFGQGSDPRLLVDTPKRAHESMYVEAVKPS
jgi:predicted SAM-dependent methyltransferase